MVLILQIIVGIGIVSMMCPGMMAGLSGGGNTPAFQRIGEVMLVLSLVVGIAGIVASIIFQRMESTLLTDLSLAVPVVVWIGLLIWLHRETGFFTTI